MKLLKKILHKILCFGGYHDIEAFVHKDPPVRFVYVCKWCTRVLYSGVERE